MNMYESMVSPSYLLIEQVARQVFDLLPENGPVVLIIDRDGHHWPSDSQAYADLNIDDGFLAKLQSRIDDGGEPVIAQQAGCTIVAAELATDRTRCGYVVLLIPQEGPEPAMANIDFLEILIGQMNLIAKLIEKNALLYELQSRNMSVFANYVQREPALN